MVNKKLIKNELNQIKYPNLNKNGKRHYVFVEGESGNVMYAI